ncbi:ABC transporter substrate-binding protein [Chelatococcus reniformis]|uniref:ABC transporter permease n=1 Tax=Chelatococcus reniformis TaxID=1494448 RepID=A0A916TZ17_9HYPH|nr:ABC transporter substrate-binding protein [Chelatococcus reniformis]GGC52768.1 ABC transporter permease [Chelatococcus reniformis]
MLTTIRAAACAALAALPLLAQPVMAQDKVLKFATPQDFTVVYTFVTAEYNQGYRDYITLINERGGLGGIKIDVLVSDHGNAIQRGMEAFERSTRDGAILVDPLSTPVSRALVTRALQDKVNLITTMSGRSDAADGTVFPYVLPMSPSYWSQVARMVDYIRQEEKDLKGKKLAYVYIDTPFGRESLPLWEALAKKDGFELQTYPYAPPGNEQSAVWTQVRRFRPDWVFIGGGGVGQPVSIKEAIRNGIRVDRIASWVWLSESDMDVVGRAEAKGVLKFAVTEQGADSKVIKDIIAEVVDKGKGAGPKDKVGTSYYNVGVMAAALAAEGARKALEKNPTGPFTGEWLNAGLTSISKFDLGGFLPPITITPEDHQGGGQGKVARWDGVKWVAVTGWGAANQDIIWEMIRKQAAEFKATGK